jgi:glutathione S-transferase
MRFTPAAIFVLALLALPLLVALFGLGLWSALALVLMLLLWRWAVIVSALTAKPTGPALRLETIGASHYVEKVRWCLDRLGVDYVEQHNLGVIGALFAGRTVPKLHLRTGAVDSTLGNSSDILRYLWGRYATELGDRAAFLEPTKEALALEAQLDRYGALQQQWVYFHILDHRKLTLHAWGAQDPSVPVWQRALARPLFPFFRFFIRRAFRIGRNLNEKTLVRVDEMLAPLEASMADGRQFILGGDRLSYADITLASLSGLWLQPDNYGGGAAGGVRIERDDAPPAMNADIDLWRDKYPRLVDHMQRLYEQERLG